MKVTAVLPVYNEGKTIGGVLDTLTASKSLSGIVIINGGSTDDTSKIIKKFRNHKNPKVKIINLPRPNGKGGAVKIGTKNIKSDVILFCDGDLVGLMPHHIDSILAPMKKGAVMVIGLRDKGNLIGNMLMPYFPLTGGERAIRTDVFRKIRIIPLSEGWGLESVMNDYCKKKGMQWTTEHLNGVDHIWLQTRKEGIMAVLKEIYDVALTRIKLIGVRYD